MNGGFIVEIVDQEFKVNSVVCFVQGIDNRPVSCLHNKLIQYKRYILLGYVKIKSVEDKENYYSVSAKYIVKDVCSGINYDDFNRALPLQGFAIGYDNLFKRNDCYDEIEERQVYAYNLEIMLL